MAVVKVHADQERGIVDAFVDLADRTGLILPSDRLDSPTILEYLDDRLEDLRLNKQQPNQRNIRVNHKYRCLCVGTAFMGSQHDS